MTRQISPGNEAATLASHAHIVEFARLDFPSGIRRFHTEIGPLAFTHPGDGLTSYDCLGDFGGIGEIPEGTEVKAYDRTIVLSGVNPTVIALFREEYFNRPVELWRGFLDTAGDLADDPPTLMFRGFMDHADRRMDRGLGVVTLFCNSSSRKLRGGLAPLYTNEDQQKIAAGDQFFEFLFRMQDLNLVWGEHLVRPRAGATPSGIRGNTAPLRIPR